MKITITPNKPLVVPAHDGEVWHWNTDDDSDFRINNHGRIELDDIHVFAPTAAQWGEIAAVALYQQCRAEVREANAEPKPTVVDSLDQFGTPPLPLHEINSEVK